MDTQRTQEAEKSCLELQDALSKQLPPEIHHKMLPASRTIALRQTSRLCCASKALAETLLLNTTVTSLDLYNNDLGEGGGRALAETLRLNTTLTSLDLGFNDLGEGGGRVLAKTLRLNTTLTSLDLFGNGLGEGGGRAFAETLRLNSTLTSLGLCNWLFHLLRGCQR